MSALRGEPKVVEPQAELNTQRSQSPPFSIRLLESPSSSSDDEQLSSLLPASYRTDSDDLVASNRNVKTCIRKELDLCRLNTISAWLWVAGRPMPPRPLHYQILLSREILVTEQMDMHLIWTTNRIFLKPVPRFLLEPTFWTCHLSCARVCRCPQDNVGSGNEKCGQRLWRCALGFLFSYVALVRYESDFMIAKDKHLLPAEVSWPSWRTLVGQLDTEHIYPEIHERFLYGELRLSRLNKIYYISQTPLRGYMSHWHQYGTFFRDNFAWLLSTTLYIAIILSAMQVGLATKTLGNNDAFQSVSYGFTLFSIFGPLAAVGLIVMVFCCIFMNNWKVTVAYKKRRFRHIKT